jgi:hypothetical protein
MVAAHFSGKDRSMDKLPEELTEHPIERAQRIFFQELELARAAYVTRIMKAEARFRQTLLEHDEGEDDE